MKDNEYDIAGLISSINKCQDIDNAVKQLDIAYESIIHHYCNQMDSAQSKQLLLLSDNIRPRYWNCVNIHNVLKNQILWISINPSGASQDKNGRYKQVKDNYIFNCDWGYLEDINYWNTLKSNIGQELLKCCGHCDLLPLHLSKEKEIWNLFFKDTSSIEFHMVVDLISCTQSLIEMIQPKLIIYSNISTKWLWGIKDSGWMGYILEPVEEYFADNEYATEIIDDLSSSINGYWHSRPGMGLFHIKGISENNISHLKTTSLRSYILFDYQVANYRWKSSALKDGDLDNIWNTINLFDTI